MSDQKEVKEKKVVLDTTNPFNTGVSYEAFLSNVEGKVTVDSMLKKHDISEADCEFIKRELKIYKKK